MAYILENNPLFTAQEETEQAAVEPKKKRGRPQKDDIVRGNSVQEGLTKNTQGQLLY